MNFYKRHLGDYAKDAGHLSMLEHGAYTLLLDRYYTTEQPIPAGDIYRVCRARSAAERAAVDAVVREFFKPDGDAFVSKRATEEIAKASHQRTVNREIGKRGGRPKQTESVSEMKTDSVPVRNPSQTPDARHQREKKPAAPSLTVEELMAEGVAEETATEFLAHRNRKGAKLTRRAWDGIASEIAKAGWATEKAITKALARGWIGFEADWVKDEKTRKADLATATVPADPESFNRTREEPMTPEQWEAAKKAKALAMGAIKNITPRAA